MNEAHLITLYLGRDCTFSQIAHSRTRAAVREFSNLRLLVKDQDEAAGDGVRVAVTPALLLPGGRRITGTPSLESLRRVLALALGNELPVPNKVWYLERSRVFKGIPRDEIEKYAHLFYEHDYKPKEIVFSEGDLGDAIYLLKHGHVRLYRVTEEGKELTLAILGPGDVFGELALFTETHRRTFAEAVDAAHICAASVEDFTRLMGHKPMLTMMVAAEMARRRQDAETRIAGLAYGSVRFRLMQALRHLASEHGEPLANGEVRILLHLSHQELAHVIGTSRESCTIELGKLQLAQLVRLDEDKHFIINPERLVPGVFDRVITALRRA